jgi:hypothetical protein
MKPTENPRCISIAVTPAQHAQRLRSSTPSSIPYVKLAKAHAAAGNAKIGVTHHSNDIATTGPIDKGIIWRSFGFARCFRVVIARPLPKFLYW